MPIVNLSISARVPQISIRGSETKTPAGLVRSLQLTKRLFNWPAYSSSVSIEIPAGICECRACGARLHATVCVSHSVTGSFPLRCFLLFKPFEVLYNRSVTGKPHKPFFLSNSWGGFFVLQSYLSHQFFSKYDRCLFSSCFELLLSFFMQLDER